MIQFEFAIPSEWLRAVTVSNAIKAEFQDKKLEGVELKKKADGYRGVDPTVLVALVAAGGTAIGAFLSGILSIAQQVSANSITLKTKSGAQITFPANMSTAELDRLIEKLKSLDDEKVVLRLDND